MKTRTRFLALAMVATLAIAGCGEDNDENSNDNGNPNPNPTTTVVRTTTPPTSTPVSTTVVATPTPVTSNSGTAQTPTPTSTGSGACEGEALSVTVTSLAGSDLDTGWTGIAHNSVSIREASITTDLNCTGNNCTVDGAALVDTVFGAPLPLSSGGVSSCVVNEFREAVTGTYDCGTGCSESAVKLRSRVFLVLDADKPCPPCVGDATPNDGVKGGACDGGKTPGAACDVGGISDLFQESSGAPPDAGRTSNDCQPNGSPVGILSIDLNPLTTGTVTVNASENCLQGSAAPGSCYCPGQVQPNACTPDGVCPASGLCEQSPPIGQCSGQKFRGCDLTNGATADCEDIFPGSGTCQNTLRPCFGSSITRTGQCGTQQGVLAAIFCIPATTAQAINTVAGLPGPGAVTLPSSQVRTLR